MRELVQSWELWVQNDIMLLQITRHLSNTCCCSFQRLINNTPLFPTSAHMQLGNKMQETDCLWVRVRLTVTLMKIENMGCSSSPTLFLSSPKWARPLRDHIHRAMGNVHGDNDSYPNKRNKYNFISSPSIIEEVEQGRKEMRDGGRVKFSLWWHQETYRERIYSLTHPPHYGYLPLFSNIKTRKPEGADNYPEWTRTWVAFVGVLPTESRSSS